MRILDCTLRDGGYYTHWDFDSSLVVNYLKTMSLLPVDTLELGYRSMPQKQYEGEYCYLPVETLQRCRALCPNKRLAVMVNLKEVNKQTVVELLKPCIGLIDLIRLAVRPEDLSLAAEIAMVIRGLGFEVACNIMYMSTWKQREGFFKSLQQLGDKVDYVWMVDSYGAVLPDEVPAIIQEVRNVIHCPLGFHGHHNLELALANSLRAIDCGVEYVDSTITGMGRGAGNLKTELLLTYLSKQGWPISFYNLSNLVDAFLEMKKEYCWGLNLPYMISGANSLPQKDIMAMMSMRRYSVTDIVEILQNNASLQRPSYPLWQPITKSHVLLIGGGPSVRIHQNAIVQYIRQHANDLTLMFASSKNLQLMQALPNLPYTVCLVGDEGHRLEDRELSTDQANFIINTQLPTITYVPDNLQNRTYALPEKSPCQYADSPLQMALQAVGDRDVMLVGFDGYTAAREGAYDLMQENQAIIDAYKGKLISLLPTAYQRIDNLSLYSLI